MAKKIVVINDWYGEDLKAEMRKAAEKAGFDIAFYETQEEAADAVADAEVIYGFPNRILSGAASLKWLCLPTAGADAFCKEGVLGEDVILTNASGAYGVTLAEFAVMVTLMLLRRQKLYDDTMRERIWHGQVPQRTLCGSRVTLLGAGDIGQCYARRIRPFEPAIITAVNRSGRTDADCFDEVYPQSALKEILPRTDILVMSLPSTPETIRILNKELIGLLPEDAYVVNVGRGTAIDEPALIEALNAGRLAGAALDVMHEEPLPADDPLWEAKNILLTPHIAGNLTTEHTRRVNVAMFLEDLDNYANGRELRYRVNRRLGY